MNISDWFFIFLILICTFGIIDTISWKPNSRLSKKSLNRFARTTLKQYLSSFKISNEGYYLCLGSAMFRKVWDRHFSQIKELAEEFLDETRFNAISHLSSILFLVPSGNIEDCRKVRILFLEWLIKRTEK